MRYIDGSVYMSLFVPRETPSIVSSFTILGKGLCERFFSNRVEYFIDEKFYSCSLDETIEEKTREINKWLLRYPYLIEFLKSEDNFAILPLHRLI